MTRHRSSAASYELRPGRARPVVLTAAAVLLAAATYVACAPPAGPRSIRAFDPDRVADLEVDMWRAYYGHDTPRLIEDLVTLMREQYRFSWARAAVAGYHLGRAARTFGDSTADYERVLPDLQAGYEQIRDWTDATFDPAAVSRAELKWWAARRVHGQNSAEQIGRLIAEENALIFGVPVEQVLEASTLRARAGRLRDDGGVAADWAAVSDLLHRSYRDLYKAVNAE